MPQLFNIGNNVLKQFLVVYYKLLQRVHQRNCCCCCCSARHSNNCIFNNKISVAKSCPNQMKRPTVRQPNSHPSHLTNYLASKPASQSVRHLASQQPTSQLCPYIQLFSFHHYFLSVKYIYYSFYNSGKEFIHSFNRSFIPKICWLLGNDDCKVRFGNSSSFSFRFGLRAVKKC